MLAGLYIVVSTLIVAGSYDEDIDESQVELIKGLLFVLVTGAGLFALSRYLTSCIARQYEQIEKHRRSIEALDKRATAGLLASAIGHDANNLLAAIRMSVDLLQHGVAPDRARSIIRTMDTTVNELMALNMRLVRGGSAEQPGELKPRCLKYESERIFQFIDQNHPVSKLKVSFKCEGDVTAPVNRHLYFQAILNLLLNVTRHAGEGATVLISISESQDGVIVEVEDDGPGVPEADREMIFTPYYSHHAEGAGLGLVSVRAVMRIHGGDIHCESSELGGARFVMHFPKNAAGSAEESQEMPVAS